MLQGCFGAAVAPCKLLVVKIWWGKGEGGRLGRKLD